MEGGDAYAIGDVFVVESDRMISVGTSAKSQTNEKEVIL